MRWPWSREPPDTAAADQALAESTRRLHEAKEQMGRVEEMAQQLRAARVVNQFGLRFIAALREHR